MGSPPPAGSKKVVLKFLSVNNMVIAPANTGRDNKSRKAVTKTDHTNRGNLCMVNPGPLILKIDRVSRCCPPNHTWQFLVIRLYLRKLKLLSLLYQVYLYNSWVTLFIEGVRGLTGFTNRMILSESPTYWAPLHDKLGGELHIIESVFVRTPLTIPSKLPYLFQFWLECREEPLREASLRSYLSPQMTQTCPNPDL